MQQGNNVSKFMHFLAAVQFYVDKISNPLSELLWSYRKSKFYRSVTKMEQNGTMQKL